jgi:hypothetical protein
MRHAVTSVRSHRRGAVDEAEPRVGSMNLPISQPQAASVACH